MTENFASVKLRLLAGLLDGLLSLTPSLAMILILSAAGSLRELLSSGLNVAVFSLFVSLILPSFLNSFLISRFGGTAGKLLTGTEIVNLEGERISFWRAFFRNHLGYMVSGVFLWLGFFWLVKDEKRRGWHDLMADTFVVVKREAGLVTGLTSLILILAFNGLLLGRIAGQIEKNRGFYQGLVREAGDEMRKILEESKKVKSTAEGDSGLPAPTLPEPPFFQRSRFNLENEMNVNLNSTPAVFNWRDCLNVSGSTILPTNPRKCLTPDGRVAVEQ